jgi:hypothetical protein
LRFGLEIKVVEVRVVIIKAYDNFSIAITFKSLRASNYVSCNQPFAGADVTTRNLIRQRRSFFDCDVQNKCFYSGKASNKKLLRNAVSIFKLSITIKYFQNQEQANFIIWN